MVLYCARLNCVHQAAASLRFDAPTSRVLLVDLTDVESGIPICGHHARTRTAPMGWTLVDERTAATQRRLWNAAAPPPSEMGPNERPAVRRPSESSFSWERGVRLSDPDNRPETPLLARAFRAAT